MIQNRNLARAARKRCVTYYFDLTATAETKKFIYDAENPIRLLRADMVYLVATDGNAQTEGIRIGTTASAESYMADMVPATSQAIGTVTAGTLLLTLVPAGTILIICRDALSGSSNTGEVGLSVWYEVLDRSPKP